MKKRMLLLAALGLILAQFGCMPVEKETTVIDDTTPDVKKETTIVEDKPDVIINNPPPK